MTEIVLFIWLQLYGAMESAKLRTLVFIVEPLYARHTERIKNITRSPPSSGRAIQSYFPIPFRDAPSSAQSSGAWSRVMRSSRGIRCHKKSRVALARNDSEASVLV